MTDKVLDRDENENTDQVQRLKPNAVGIIGVLFMAVATAAPITAMVGNVPIAVGFGNGSHAPGETINLAEYPKLIKRTALMIYRLTR